MRDSVYCLCHTETQANAILTALRNEGFSSEISLLLQDRSDTKNVSARENAARGAGIGSIAGALLALTIPGIGAALAVGPLLAALGGAAAGGVVGGLAGGSAAFKPLGLPDQVSEHLHHRIAQGDILVGVHTSDPERLRRALAICRTEGAPEVFEGDKAA